MAKAIFPARLIRQLERPLRNLASLPYRGRAVQCNICLTGLKYFISLPDGDLLCPKCGSRSRTRMLFNLVTSMERRNQQLLHFSPPSGLSRIFKKRYGKRYVTSDFLDEFSADLQLDITQLDLLDNSFDLILCLHVLEHIDNDRAAMRELARVLRCHGSVIIQTPFWGHTYRDDATVPSGSDQDKFLIYEDPSISSPDERLKHFGQEDHVRWYTAKGLANRLAKECPELDVNIKKYPEKPELGILPEVFIIATKSC